MRGTAVSTGRGGAGGGKKPGWWSGRKGPPPHPPGVKARDAESVRDSGQEISTKGGTSGEDLVAQGTGGVGIFAGVAAWPRLVGGHELRQIRGPETARIRRL